MARKKLKCGSRMWKAFQEFADHTTAHGLSTAINGSTTARVFWSFVFLCAFSMSLFLIGQSVEKFLRYEIATSISLSFDPIPFPAVTICNLNPYRVSKLNGIPELATLQDAFNAAVEQAKLQLNATFIDDTTPAPTTSTAGINRRKRDDDDDDDEDDNEYLKLVVAAIERNNFDASLPQQTITLTELREPTTDAGDLSLEPDNEVNADTETTTPIDGHIVLQISASVPLIADFSEKTPLLGFVDDHSYGSAEKSLNLTGEASNINAKNNGAIELHVNEERGAVWKAKHQKAKLINVVQEGRKKYMELPIEREKRSSNTYYDTCVTATVGSSITRTHGNRLLCYWIDDDHTGAGSELNWDEAYDFCLAKNGRLPYFYKQEDLEAFAFFANTLGTSVWTALSKVNDTPNAASNVYYYVNSTSTCASSISNTWLWNYTSTNMTGWSYTPAAARGFRLDVSSKKLTAEATNANYTVACVFESVFESSNAFCAQNCSWSEWGAWGTCSVTCGSGTWTRTRKWNGTDVLCTTGSNLIETDDPDDCAMSPCSAGAAYSTCMSGTAPYKLAITHMSKNLCYWIDSSTSTYKWSTAQAKCVGMGGHLPYFYKPADLDAWASMLAASSLTADDFWTSLGKINYMYNGLTHAYTYYYFNMSYHCPYAINITWLNAYTSSAIAGTISYRNYSFGILYDGASNKLIDTYGTGDSKAGWETATRVACVFGAPNDDMYDVCNNCAWATWQAWTTCSKTCDQGTQTRNRSLSATINPTYCDTAQTQQQIQNCTIVNCPINCTWGAWGAWGGCSKTCDYGTSTRTRSKTQPELYGGTCAGTGTDYDACFSHECTTYSLDCPRLYGKYNTREHRYSTTNNITGSTLPSVWVLRRPYPELYSIPVWELYSAIKSAYFYTSKADTRVSMLDQDDWRCNGVAFYVLGDNVTSGSYPATQSSPLYRLVTQYSTTDWDIAISTSTNDGYMSSPTNDETIGRVWTDESYAPCFGNVDCNRQSNANKVTGTIAVNGTTINICYDYYDQPMTWSNAQAYCTQRGGSLPYFYTEQHYWQFATWRRLSEARDVWTAFQHTLNNVTLDNYFVYTSTTSSCKSTSSLNDTWMANPVDPIFDSKNPSSQYVYLKTGSDKQLADASINTNKYVSCIYENPPADPCSDIAETSTTGYDVCKAQSANSNGNADGKVYTTTQGTQNLCYNIYMSIDFDHDAQSSVSGPCAWSDAAAYCSERNGSLAYFFNEPQFIAVKSKVNSLSQRNSWIGMVHDNGFISMNQTYWYLATDMKCKQGIASGSYNFWDPEPNNMSYINKHFYDKQALSTYYAIDWAESQNNLTGNPNNKDYSFRLRPQSTETNMFVCVYANPNYAQICSNDTHTPPGPCSDFNANFTNGTVNYALPIHTQGSTAQLSCPSPFIFEGYPTMTCMDEQWTPNITLSECKPQCGNIPVTTTPTPPTQYIMSYVYQNCTLPSCNGISIINKTNGNMPAGNSRAGTIVTLQCPNGWDPLENFTSTCENINQVGKWNPANFTCKQTCNDLPFWNASNYGSGPFYSDLSLFGKPYEGVTANFTCDANRLLTYNDPMVCKNGKWTSLNQPYYAPAPSDAKPPTCIETCNDLTMPGGYVSYSIVSNLTNRTVDDLRPIGSLAVYNCYGDSVVVGPLKKQCLANRTWNLQEDPTCLPVPHQVIEQINDLKKDIALYLNDPVSLQALLNDALAYFASNLDPSTLKDIGYQIDELVVDCTYRDDNCNITGDFTSYLDASYGNCYQYNNNKTNPRMASRAGKDNGLSLELYAKQDNYSSTADRAGFVIVVHGQEDTVLADSMGQFIAPGFETELVTKYSTTTKLEKPYGTCIHDPGEANVDFYYNTTYSLEGCFRSCLQRQLCKECGCGNPSIPLPEGYTYCNTSLRTCVTAFKEDLNNCSCPMACVEKIYEATFSQTLWPSDNFPCNAKIASVHSAYNQEIDCLNSFHRRNYAKIHVFLARLDYQTVVESPAYSISNLLSDFGGQLGLWIGLSVITLAEFIALFFQIVHYAARHEMYDEGADSGQEETESETETETESSSGETESGETDDDETEPVTAPSTNNGSTPGTATARSHHGTNGPVNYDESQLTNDAPAATMPATLPGVVQE